MAKTRQTGIHPDTPGQERRAFIIAVVSMLLADFIGLITGHFFTRFKRQGRQVPLAPFLFGTYTGVMNYTPFAHSTSDFASASRQDVDQMSFVMELQPRGRWVEGRGEVIQTSARGDLDWYEFVLLKGQLDEDGALLNGDLHIRGSSGNHRGVICIVVKPEGLEGVFTGYDVKRGWLKGLLTLHKSLDMT